MRISLLIVVLVQTCHLSVGSTNSTCISDLQCAPDRMCHNSSCVCRDNYYIDPVDTAQRRCLRRVPQEGACTADYQCGFNSECTTDATKHRCECKVGYYTYIEPVRYTNCYKVGGCHSDGDCTVFSNSYCRDKLCSCKPGYISVEETCVQENAPIGFACVFWMPDASKGQHGCSTNALCKRFANWQDPQQPLNTCQCWLGYTPSPDQFSCQKINCTKNEDCDAHFANTRCDLDRHECTCVHNFSPYYGESCFLNSGIQRLNGGQCYNDGDCGDNAVCTDSDVRKCQCQAGSKPEKNNVNCRKISCATDLDCTREQPHTACNTTAHTCMASHSWKSSLMLTNGLVALHLMVIAVLCL